MNALRITLNNDNMAQWIGLIEQGLYFAHCNFGESNRAYPEYAKDANLIITLPHENAVYEYTYFFDIRDVMNEDHRREGTTDLERMRFTCNVRFMEVYNTFKSEFRRLEDEADEDDPKYLRLEKLVNRLDRLMSDFDDYVYELEEEAEASNR